MAQVMKDRPLITVDNLSVRRGDGWGLRGASWRIQAGQRWLVTGPTGCGKSTLAAALTGELPAARGRVRYHFLADPDDVPGPHDVIHVSAEAQVDLLQACRPYYQARWNAADEEDSPTVDDFLSAARIYGVSRYQVLGREDVPRGFPRWREAAIRDMDIRDLLSRRVGDLSNGEARNVLLARALAQRPRVLLLDDPFGGLDIHARRHLAGVIRRRWQAGWCVVILATEEAGLPLRTTHVLSLGRERGNVLAPVRRLPSARGGRPAPAVLLELHGVGVRYGRARVIRGLDWTVRRGERWLLLGPNGSGKTTLLGLVMGDHPQAYANDVRVFGRRRGSGESIWDIKKRIGWVAPEMQVHFPQSLTGLEAVCSGFFDELGLYHACRPAQVRRARAWLRALGIGALAGRLLADLSPGQQRLVLIARAMVKSPWLLVLDEPCQGLDAAHRDRVLAVIDRIGRDTTTALIYVTHRPEEQPACCTKVLRLPGRGATSNR